MYIHRYFDTYQSLRNLLQLFQCILSFLHKGCSFNKICPGERWVSQTWSKHWIPNLCLSKHLQHEPLPSGHPMAVRSFFSGFSVNGEKRQTPSGRWKGTPRCKVCWRMGPGVEGSPAAPTVLQLTSKDGVVVEEEVLLRRFGRWNWRVWAPFLWDLKDDFLQSWLETCFQLQQTLLM